MDLIFVASEQKMGSTYSRTIACGLEVLDVRDERGASARSGDVESLPIGVIVAVTNEQAELLALAAENGQIYLVIDAYEPLWPEGLGAGALDLAGGS